MRYTDDRTRLTVEIESKGCEIPADERERLQPALNSVGEAVRDFASSELRVNLIYHPNSREHHARYELHLPGKTIFAGARDTYLDTALQRGVKNLNDAIEAYRRNPERNGAADEVREGQGLEHAFLSPDDPRMTLVVNAAREGDYRTFRTALAGYEEWIRRRVGRWVQRYPEAEARVGQDLLIGDLVEQVYLLAFEQFPRRNLTASLHEWFEDLLDPALKALLRKTDQEHETASLARTVRATPME